MKEDGKMRWPVIGTLLILVLTGTAGCLKNTKNDLGFPEANDPDWKVLRENVIAYGKARGAVNNHNLLLVQSNFRVLTENHTGDRIGDEALYYVGRIYYDIRDYHDARRIFRAHRELYPSSPFGPTIDELEAEMKADTERYHEWLNKSRTVSGQ